MKTGPVPRTGGCDDVIAVLLSWPHSSLTDETAVASPLVGRFFPIRERDRRLGDITTPLDPYVL